MTEPYVDSLRFDHGRTRSMSEVGGGALEWLFAFTCWPFRSCCCKTGSRAEGARCSMAQPGDTVGNTPWPSICWPSHHGCGSAAADPQTGPLGFHMDGRSYILAAVTSSSRALPDLDAPDLRSLVERHRHQLDGVLVIVFAAIAFATPWPRHPQSSAMGLRLFMVASASGYARRDALVGVPHRRRRYRTTRRLPDRLWSRRISANTCCRLRCSRSISAPVTGTTRTSSWRRRRAF